MLVVMQHNAPPEQIAAVCEAIRQMGLTPHPMPGPTRTAIGITGNTQAIDAPRLEVQPGVMELIRVTKPYKLASREMHPDDTHRRTRPDHRGEWLVHDHRRSLQLRRRINDASHCRASLPTEA